MQGGAGSRQRGAVYRPSALPPFRLRGWAERCYRPSAWVGWCGEGYRRVEAWLGWVPPGRRGGGVWYRPPYLLGLSQCRGSSVSWPSRIWNSMWGPASVWAPPEVPITCPACTNWPLVTWSEERYI